MSAKRSRRQFMQASALTGAGFFVAAGVEARASQSPNEKIRFACVGVGGKGGSDSADCGANGDVVAICDVDDNTLNAGSQKFPNARKFTDFRKMFDDMAGSIDAVTVSTPDHTHAVAAVMAMRLGKHCFCQKPLTHSLYEARVMATIAKEKGVATQMGNQGTAEPSLRRAAAFIKSGALGKITEVHVWTNRPIWAQGGDRPKEAPVPPHVHWEEWLGPAPYRPYAPGYHPFAWRGWWDFGTGALGDMACHTMNMPFQALNLRDPIAVTAECSGHNKDSFPKWSIIKYEFGEYEGRAPVTMHWYDGGKRPDKELLNGREPASSGALAIGERGKLYAPGDYAEKEIILLGTDEVVLRAGSGELNVDFKESPGHFAEWVAAIRGGEPAMSNFPNYSGPLTETVLLGNLAVWATGKRVEWNAKNLTSPNSPEVAHIIKPEMRSGYVL
jgi:predicted dehydrogenase